MLTSELLDLKTELQCTLTRLSNALTTSEINVDPRHPSRAAEERPGRGRQTKRSTGWDRLHELRRKVTAASIERRALELQLQLQLQRQTPDLTQELLQDRRRCAGQRAIAQLQEQQAQIRRELERDKEEKGVDERQETKDSGRCDGSSGRETQTRYSIGGVVTLEPLSSLEQEKQKKRKKKKWQQFPRRGVTVACLQPKTSRCRAVDVREEVEEVGRGHTSAAHTRDMHDLWRAHYPKPPDALTDVFKLQLKFAETMLKLEKSVQVRDQLLQDSWTTSMRKSRTGTKKKEKAGQVRHCCRQAVRSGESEVSSDASVSSLSSSFSSLESTPDCSQTIGIQYPKFRVSKATTAETLVPTSFDADNSPSGELTGLASISSIATSSHGSIEEMRNIDAERGQFNGQEAETYETPTTGSSGTTPTTGSDQKSTSSVSKQVRFGDDAYSTPVLARKFNFDGPSIDDDDDGEKEQKEESESIFSFLGGSSVSSTELNDVSLLRAFERFRRELNASELTKPPVDPPLVRKLFSEPSVAEPGEPVNIKRPEAEGVQDSGVELIAEADVCDSIATIPAPAGLSIAKLQERRRQLCLDIQAASAQLVLNSGRVLDVTGSREVNQTQNHLISMRDELKLIDARLRAS
uniref:Uncharacterized protein n=1 Tax=Hyaloperonospora arabidopsidis (strain Emoy2) TaxID=559515 RepID=M4BUS2_HYAAE